MAVNKKVKQCKREVFSDDDPSINRVLRKDKSKIANYSQDQFGR